MTAILFTVQLSDMYVRPSSVAVPYGTLTAVDGLTLAADVAVSQQPQGNDKLWQAPFWERRQSSTAKGVPWQ